jgi:glutathione peroxidase
MEDRMSGDFYTLSAKANDGKEFPFERLRGKAVLVVNTASRCGFTPQYRGLEALYEKYKERGLEIIGFPCDQFAHQEPGSDAEIAAFCRRDYGVSFPLMSKIAVNGRAAHPAYVYLKKAARGSMGSRIKWNFTKFLVSRDGSKVSRYPPTTEPESLATDIEAALAE